MYYTIMYIVHTDHPQFIYYSNKLWLIENPSETYQQRLNSKILKWADELILGIHKHRHPVIEQI